LNGLKNTSGQESERLDLDTQKIQSVHRISITVAVRTCKWVHRGRLYYNLNEGENGECDNRSRRVHQLRGMLG
jgi:hypothetical protein